METLPSFDRRILAMHRSRRAGIAEVCARLEGELLGLDDHDTVPLLRSDSAAEFGQLMNECHASLRDLHEASCPEPDAMVSAAQGCTVNLVAAAAEAFTRELAQRYQRATGKTPEIYVCQPVDGAGVVG